MLAAVTTYTNVIGNTPIVWQTPSKINITQFNVDVAANVYLLKSVTIVSDNMAQLQEAFGLVVADMNGDESGYNKTFFPDARLFNATLEKQSFGDFVLDGNNRIDYNILPNTRVRLILNMEDSPNSPHRFLKKEDKEKYDYVLNNIDPVVSNSEGPVTTTLKLHALDVLFPAIILFGVGLLAYNVIKIVKNGNK